MSKNNSFSHYVSVFHGSHLPEQEALLAGYSALIKTYDLQAPIPEVLSAISGKHKKYQEKNWVMLTPRHTPHESLYGHLTFALKYEGVNLSVLKALFDVIPPEEIINIVKLKPTGAYSRRIWFIYEWLQRTELDLPDVTEGNAVNALDNKLQYAGLSRLSKRHRVFNNLPGVPDFCPIVRKTPQLSEYQNLHLNECAQAMLSSVNPDILARAAAFMLLKDSKASYAIEGENPPQTRMERWGNAIGQAGTYELSHDEFLRLQEIIISDFRFIHYGYRNEGGFVGEHQRSTGLPIPDHISARPQDIFTLMEGLIETNQLLKESDFDPIMAAAIIAFGFVFIHPFEDGNGRLHRYLIHHVLAEKRFIPQSVVFPVSSIILDKIDEYKLVLESFSKPRLKLIQWAPTTTGNVEVKNNTIDLYRYFDATKQVEFLYHCLKEAIDKTLPEEVDYLKKYDAMKHFIKNYIDMPDRLIDLLIRFLNQENGTLSKRAKRKEFSSLTEIEATEIEKKYAEIFMRK